MNKLAYGPVMPSQCEMDKVHVVMSCDLTALASYLLLLVRARAQLPRFLVYPFAKYMVRSQEDFEVNLQSADRIST
jgi:hypothetical protein